MTAVFGAESTTDEVLEGVDLSGKRILVTGASAGLGVETIRVLAAHGADILGAARDLEKARRALEPAFAQAAKGARIDLVELDLASLASVRRATDEIVAQGRSFDVIIANAGVMACPQGETADGFETQLGTNHLGHFVFVNRLASLLGNPSRVIVLSSSGHRLADVDLDDPGFDRTPYHPFTALAGRRRRTYCSPSDSIAVCAAAAYAPVRSTRAASGPSSAGTSRRRSCAS